MYPGLYLAILAIGTAGAGPYSRHRADILNGCLTLTDLKNVLYTFLILGCYYLMIIVILPFVRIFLP